MNCAVNVLIVDDSVIASGRLRLMLEEIEGVNVVGQAGSVAEAMMFLKVWLPHLIVLDMKMPDGSGIEVLRHIKKWHPATAVAVLTNSPHELLRRQCEEAGADRFLDKSHEFERLPEIVAEVRARKTMHKPQATAQSAP